MDVDISELIDYPPRLLIYVKQTECSSNLTQPEVQVVGLDRECSFELPVRGENYKYKLCKTNIGKYFFLVSSQPEEKVADNAMTFQTGRSYHVVTKTFIESNFLPDQCIKSLEAQSLSATSLPTTSSASHHQVSYTFDRLSP